MCGIAGFSLSQNSKINARELANSLLSEIEYRGTDASGFAYMTTNGDMGVHKEPVRGSHLALKGLPRNAKTVILHTRLGTHGTHLDNANNHPLPSPNGDILLTHNGVIWNHQEVRHLFGFDTLPEVDSSVIPALIEKSGPDSVENLGGAAAIAWLDKQTPGMLHLARVSDNPIAYARLLDGSFVYASTQDLLANALMRLKIEWIGSYPHPFEEFADQDYVQVEGGKVTLYRQLPESQGWGFTSTYQANAWKRATSGGHGSESAMFRDDPSMAHADDDEEAYAQWWNAQGYGDTYPKDGDDLSYQDDMAVRIGQKALERGNVENTGPGRSDKFYVLDHDGDYQGYTNLDALTTTLMWYAGRTGGEEITADGEDRWVRHFCDVGEVGDDGELRSWVESPELTFFHEHEMTNASDDLAFIRSGADLLVKVMSA